jgi:hypothetical protein
MQDAITKRFNPLTGIQWISTVPTFPNPLLCDGCPVVIRNSRRFLFPIPHLQAVCEDLARPEKRGDAR